MSADNKGKPLSQSLDELARHYGERVASEGATAKGAGWRDEATQELRFSELLRVIAHEGVYTLADLGCGYGALLHTMPESLRSRMSAYTGYDISEQMVEAAREKAASFPNAHFIASGTITQPVDYVVASGIFNHHFNADKDEWEAHILRTIDHMGAYAKKGFAFNIMSRYVDYQEDYIHYADPADMLRYCLDKFGRHVSLNHNYPLYEFTVMVWK